MAKKPENLNEWFRKYWKMLLWYVSHKVYNFKEFVYKKLLPSYEAMRVRRRYLSGDNAKWFKRRLGSGSGHYYQR